MWTGVFKLKEVMQHCQTKMAKIKSILWTRVTCTSAYENPRENSVTLLREMKTCLKGHRPIYNNAVFPETNWILFRYKCTNTCILKALVLKNNFLV